jgi:hypothetical protein
MYKQGSILFISESIHGNLWKTVVLISNYIYICEFLWRKIINDAFRHLLLLFIFFPLRKELSGSAEYLCREST